MKRFMDNYINRLCLIHIIKQYKDLFYEATINDVTDEHIMFTDKYGNFLTFKLCYVEQITPKEEKNKW